jgi:hypothetical protein
MTPDSTDLTPAELEAQDAQLIRAGFYAARLELFPRQVLGINTRTILYGDAREPPEQCAKCREGKGALVGCVVIKGIESCANCSWNRSGGPCSCCPRMCTGHDS